MTFEQFRERVVLHLLKDFGIDSRTLDLSPLRYWHAVQLMKPDEAARQLAIKDGFPDDY